MNKTYKGTVLYHGIEFEVEGEYVPHIPAKLTADPYYSTPPEGGYFEELYIKHKGEDITDLLDCHVQNAIEQIAQEDIV